MATLMIGIRDAKSRLSELIREARDGTDVIILRHGDPVAKLVPWPPARPDRAFGVWAGRVRSHDDDSTGPDADITEFFDESADAAPEVAPGQRG